MSTIQQGATRNEAAKPQGAEQPLLEDHDYWLVESFENGSLPPEELNHTAHIRLAWAYFQMLPLLPALCRLTSGLQRYTRLHGAEGKYHQTVTLAYSLAVYERLREDPSAAMTWQSFEAKNALLFEPGLGLLRQYYQHDTLRSEQARLSFVLPDRKGG